MQNLKGSGECRTQYIYTLTFDIQLRYH